MNVKELMSFVDFVSMQIEIIDKAYQSGKCTDEQMLAQIMGRLGRIKKEIEEMKE